MQRKMIVGWIFGVLFATGCAEPGMGAEASARTAEILENLMIAGYTEDDITILDVTDDFIAGIDDVDIDAGVASRVYVQGDTHVTLEASRMLAAEASGTSFRHWRSPALVSNNNTICLVRVVAVHSASPQHLRLSSRMQTAVSRAATNYNNVSGMGLDFLVKDGTRNYLGGVVYNTSGCDFEIIIEAANGDAGGLAGFPTPPPWGSTITPYPRITLYNDLNGSTFNTDVVEHVVTHEIGHCIGLRHSDWKTRTSCGSGSSGESQSGAQRISGTPDQTTNSVMKACFTTTESGNFRGDDVTALQTIY